MHYASTYACKERLRDRPEAIEPCGTFAARQRVRDDPVLADHDRVTWEYSTAALIKLPPGFSDEQVEVVIRATVDGMAEGARRGRDDLQRELRELLGIET